MRDKRIKKLCKVGRKISKIYYLLNSFTLVKSKLFDIILLDMGKPLNFSFVYGSFKMQRMQNIFDFHIFADKLVKEDCYSVLETETRQKMFGEMKKLGEQATELNNKKKYQNPTTSISRFKKNFQTWKRNQS